MKTKFATVHSSLKTRIIELADSSADTAIDQSGPGREYATLDEAVTSCLNNAEDTMREWGVTAVREFVAMRTYFEMALMERGCAKRWVKS